LGLGFALRFGLAVKEGLNAPPPTGSDALEIDTYAWNLAQGRGYRGMSPDVTDQDHLTAYRPPGTSLVWAAIYKVAGHRYDWVRVTHCVFSTATILLVYWIGRACFSDRVGLLSAMVWTFWPTGLVYASVLLAEPTALFFLVGSVLACLIFAERPNTVRAGLAGVALGLTLLMRPSTLFLVPLLSIWGLWQFRSDRKALLLALAIPFIGGLCLVPWTIRNYKVFGKFIPLSTMGGSTLLQGNNIVVVTNKTYYGFSVWDTKINDDIARQLQAPNNEYERDKVAGRLAFEWLKDNPDQWWYLLQAKFRRSWTPVIQQPSLAKRLVNWLTWGLVLALFSINYIPTLVDFLRRRHPGWIIHLTILHYTITSLIFYALVRYRYAIEAFCIILAMAAVDWLWNRLSRPSA
jgi:4-amino-4-deoxy-L-arabinose transferase-like glycosyltransferase